MQQGIPKEPDAIKTWWGNKQKIKNFLDSPYAKDERWFIRACPECSS